MLHVDVEDSTQSRLRADAASQDSQACLDEEASTGIMQPSGVEQTTHILECHI